MPRFNPSSLSVLVFVGALTLFTLGIDLISVLAAPLWQFPTNSVTIISDPPPADLQGQFSDLALLQPNLLDPDPLWRDPTFDDSGWQDTYPSARLAGWGDPLADPASPADFVWGGTPGTGPDANGRFNIPTTPAPQFLFLRKNFCIPINADINTVGATTPLRWQIAATPGSGSVYFNGAAIATGQVGDETGGVSSLILDPAVVSNARLGRNTLAMRVRDDVVDTNAGLAYDLTFDYTIDPTALTITPSPPSPAPVNATVTFDQTNNGLSGDTPFTFDWDLGNGTTSTASAPTIAYTTPGTYTVVLTMTDRFGCPTAPVTLDYVVEAQTQVSFSSATYTVAESDGVAIITVVLDAPATQTVTVTYATADGTATAGSDYTTANNTLTFAPGQTSQTFIVPILTDSLTEGAETVILTLSNPVNAVIIDPNPATLTITDQPPEDATNDKKNDNNDDDDDDGGAAPPPPPPATVAPLPSPVPTEVADFPLTLPETGLLERPAQTVVFTGLRYFVVIGLSSLIVALVGYYIVRHRRG